MRLVASPRAQAEPRLVRRLNEYPESQFRRSLVSDVDFQLSVSATSTETLTGDTSTTTGTIDVSVAADADAPTLDLDSTVAGDQSTGAAGGLEDEPIDLDIASALTDTDGSEALSITIEGVPAGATLNYGTFDPQTGNWTLAESDLAGLQVNPAPNSNDDFTLRVTATSTEADGGDTESVIGNISVSVTGVADTPEVTFQDETGFEDQWTQLHLDANLTDTDGSETLSIQITGVPDGAILSPGTFVSTGVWTVSEAQLPLVCIRPPSDFSGDMTMTLSVTSTEDDGNSTTVDEPFTVSVTGVADAADLGVANASGVEDRPIDLDIKAALNDTDGSETLSIEIAGVPDGATLNHGTFDQTTGIWTLDADDLTGLQITPAPDSSADFGLQVSAITTEADGDTETVTQVLGVTVTPQGDAPTIEDITDQVALASDADIALQQATEELFDHLQEIEGVDPADLTGVDMSNISLPNEHSVSVTFQGEGAGYQNSLGYYKFDADGNITDVEFVWENASAQGSGGDLNPGESTVNLGLDAGESFGFFIVGNGNSQNDYDQFGEGHLEFRDGDGSANADSSDPQLVFVRDDGTVIEVNGNVYHTAGMGDQTALNPDGEQHAVTGLNTVTGTLMIGFEDLLGGGDSDFNDLLISVDIGADNARELDPAAIAPEIDLADVDSSELIGAVIQINGGFSEGDALRVMDGALEGTGVTVASQGIDPVTGNYSIVLDGAATVEEYETILGTVKFASTADNVAGGTRSITFQVTDSEGNDSDVSSMDFTIDAPADTTAEAPTLSVALGEPTPEISTAYSDEVAAHNPIAYYQLGETSGTTAVDSAGNHDGTYTNGVTLGAEGVVSNSSAASFDGSNDYVEIPHSDDMLLDNGTVSLWFKADDADDKGALFSKDSKHFDDGGHLTARVNDGQVEIRLQSDDESYYVRGGSIEDGDWNQVTFSFGSDGMQLYINGELVDSNDYTGGLGLTSGDDGNPEPWTLGASQTHSGNETADDLRDYFEGELDEFAIYDQALSAEDIQSLYTTGVEDSGANNFPLDISASLVDTDGSESLSITVGGIPEGASLSAGTDNGNGTWTLETGDLNGLNLRVEDDVTTDFDLTVTATSTESAGGDTATTEVTIPIDLPEPGYDFEGTSGEDVLIGGEGADSLTGNSDEDILMGRGGDDVLDGGSSDDQLFGGEGNDVLDGGSGDNVLDGGAGDDEATGGSGNDMYLFKEGDGNDTLHGGSGTDIIHLAGANGGLPNGEWTLSLTSGEIDSEDDDHWHLTSGATGTITFADGSTLAFDSVERIDWSDHVNFNGDDVRFADGDGDTVTGTGEEEVLIGGAGNDTIRGKSDEDMLLGGAGDDNLRGEDGRDFLDGGAGMDTLDGGKHDDYLDGGAGDDVLDGGRHDDVLVGGAGNDTLDGGDDEDFLIGGAGNDYLDGGDDDDVLMGGAGDDTLVYHDDNDVLLGGSGDDTFVIDAHQLVNHHMGETVHIDSYDESAGILANAADTDDYTLSETMQSGMDGGSGDDTLRIEADNDVSIELGEGDYEDAISAIDNIENIDLTHGDGDVNLGLSLDDVVNLTDENNVLTILADSGDSVTFNDDAANQPVAGASGEEVDGFTTYTYFDDGGGVLAKINVQDETPVI